MVGSYLGETASRLARLLDYVRTQECVLFLDEFETLGKERGDVHETGEIKRVVSSLLMQIDQLPSHVVVVAATNHPELLDRAVWRRFQVRLNLPSPGQLQVKEWLMKFEAKFDLTLGHSPETLATKLGGLSFAEIEEFCTDVLRRLVLDGGEGETRTIVSTRLRQWEQRRGAKPTRRSNG
jgi:AAA+ superfamily predicted ATPase